MFDQALLFTFALIFGSAAILATFAMYARQSLIVVYILLGMVLGPWGAKMVDRPELIQQSAHFGIVFLLFLLGLNLRLGKLLTMLRSAMAVTVISSVLFFIGGFLVGLAVNLTLVECIIIGAAMTFSSTIISLKLLPSRDLYRERIGEIIIAVLLLQDVLAIVVLTLLQGLGKGEDPMQGLALMLLAIPGLFVAALLVERYVLDRLVARFDAVSEYLFLLAVGWCLSLAMIGELTGLSAEVGAFIAGVVLATSRASRFFARRMQPLRDFFLVLFFFGVGASINLLTLGDVWLHAFSLAALMLVLKPWVFSKLLQRGGEEPWTASEVGVRLGQSSEFSLLLAFVAAQSGLLSDQASDMLQLATIITFVFSTFVVNRRYPTPNFPPTAEANSPAAEDADEH